MNTRQSDLGFPQQLHLGRRSHTLKASNKPMEFYSNQSHYQSYWLQKSLYQEHNKFFPRTRTRNKLFLERLQLLITFKKKKFKTYLRTSKPNGKKTQTQNNKFLT